MRLTDRPNGDTDDRHRTGSGLLQTSSARPAMSPFSPTAPDCPECVIDAAVSHASPLQGECELRYDN
jgi:hypothetical protein